MQPHHNRHWRKEGNTGGLFLLLAGGILLARQLGAPLPDWLFSWPMLLVLIGLYMGIKLRFRNVAWIIPLLIGLVFLCGTWLPGINLKPFLAPILLITIGLLFIFRSRRDAAAHQHAYWEQSHSMEGDALPPEAITDRSDFIDSTAVFAGIKKMVLSKNFHGGDITNFMGGSEINLTQADFSGRVRIDSTNVFGGTKLVVPANWDVQSEVVAFFGGVEDKRRYTGIAPDPDKILILDGTCVFGGIEINSY